MDLDRFIYGLTWIYLTAFGVFRRPPWKGLSCKLQAAPAEAQQEHGLNKKKKNKNKNKNEKKNKNKNKKNNKNKNKKKKKKKNGSNHGNNSKTCKAKLVLTVERGVGKVEPSKLTVEPSTNTTTCST